MIRFRTQLASLPVLAFGVLTAASSHAASLVKVSNWNGGVSLPSDVSMYAYVPDKVATNPPLLTLIHYCGGSATAVFNQAKGNGTTNGGIVQAADQYGFILVVPDNGGRCWDVTSTKTHTRNGGGDSHAVIQMVRYALTQYQANANRVYSTGDSSGAMMTELLLALYPDVYKAGSAFAGVPAGCANEFDGSGLCGLPTQTAQQWGDRVRAMDPGYTGHRPRVQLFHGDADATITYKNLAQAINEWTNVLGLDATPTSTTSSGLTLGTHQATEKQWKNSCGYLVLDALTSVGGDHGPSDALFEAKYVIPFLGLDKTGAVDPEIAQCGGGGAAGTGGTSSIGGATGTGGTKASGGTSSATGGKSGVTGGTSGVQPTGGTSSNGGAPATGGQTGVGGGIGGGTTAAQTGGRSATGGSNATGGNAPTGGNPATGGQLGQGGNLGTGGAVATGTGGGPVVAGTGGSKPGTGGNSSVSNSGPSPAGDSGGCSCTVAGTKRSPTGLLAVALGAMLVIGRRKKR